MAPLFVILACLAILIGALLTGGGGLPTDPALLAAFLDLSQGQPRLITALIAVTHLGSAVALLAIAAGACVSLFRQQRKREALGLMAIIISGRLAVEAIKLLVERPRPDLIPHPVVLHSFSFPSGHAANSMITFLAIALIVPEPSRRGPAVAVAILTSVLIGLTRPLLGVHWPSDVVAGWAFGIAWVAAAAPAIRQRGETEA